MPNVAHLKETEIFPDKVKSCHWYNNDLRIDCDNGVALAISPINDDVIRFRYATEGIFSKDFSYAIDPKYVPEPAQIEHFEDHSSFIIKTRSIDIHIDKKHLTIRILNKNGQVINEDEKGFHWEENDDFGGNIVKLTKKTQPYESFYGLGDKPTDLRLNEKRLSNWGTDRYGFERDSDPSYKNIPFYYGLNDGLSYGIFFDNSFRTYFDFGAERREATTFWADGGEINYYFIYGHTLTEVCQKYTLLTGTPDMPAMWSLGFQQCKWSYYPESQVRDICDKLRQYEIPCDAIYLDIDYMDGFRCFTWDKEKFPNPEKMVSDLKNQGFKTVVIIDPGIKKDNDYWVFKEALEKDYFCKRADGDYMQGKVWPGECYFPDFTNAEVRDWWAGLYKELVEEIGVAGVWNDMNEPAVMDYHTKTFPIDVRHDYDGHPCSHRKAHNVYGMQMARATFEGMQRYSHGKRPLVITRSGYAGMQRFTCVWTGDNIATWEHLWIANVQCQKLSVSGLSFTGSDIGGFIGTPGGELFVRWIQLGIFHPFCRVHSSGDHGDQEPWSFGKKYLEHFKEAIELRYQLLPYIYTSFYQYTTLGEPILKPLIFYDQTDPENVYRDHEFVCGRHILTKHVMHEGQKSVITYLPAGGWYDYWSNLYFEGKHEVNGHFPLSKFPMYIKSGAIIPLYPVQQYVDEKKMLSISLNVYYKNGREDSYLFDDAHDGQEYKYGQYKLSRFRFEATSDYIKISQEVSGDWRPPYTHYDFQFIGIPFKISRTLVDGINRSTQGLLSVGVDFINIQLFR